MTSTKQFILLFTFSLSTACAQAAELTQERKQQLDNLLIQDCGSCHGLKLTGGLGPALTRDKLEHKSIDVLADIILLGVPNTAMPPWNELLSEADAIYLAKQLKNQ